MFGVYLEFSYEIGNTLARAFIWKRPRSSLMRRRQGCIKENSLTFVRTTNKDDSQNRRKEEKQNSRRS